MAVEVLSEYAGATATSHTVPLNTENTPEAGRTIIVFCVAAAGLPAAPSGWTKDTITGFTSALNDAAIYRLPAASNDGSRTSISLTLSAARAMSAVAIQLDMDGSATVAGTLQSAVFSGTSIATNTVTTGSGVESIAFFLMTANASGPVVPAPSSFNNGFTLLADSGTLVEAAEDARVVLALGGELSGAAVTMTLAEGTTGTVPVRAVMSYAPASPPVTTVELVPSSVTSSTGWTLIGSAGSTTAALSDADDATLLRSTGANTLTVALSNPGDTGSRDPNGDWIISVRAKANNGSATMTLRLIEDVGGTPTTRAEWTGITVSSLATIQRSLNSSQAGTIVDVNNLSVQIIDTTTRS